jgi:hypothetical protein
MLVARGAAAGDPDLDHARTLFDEAGELERHGQWGPAQSKLREAMHLRETPQLHYALGWALENDDKLLEARVEYDTTVKQGQNRSGAEEATRLAKERLADLDKKTPLIKVHLAGHAPETTRILIDGKEVKREDDTAATPVNPGSHVIRVERTGGADQAIEAIEQVTYVGRSAVRTIEVDTGDAVAPRDTPQERHTAPAPPSPLRMTAASTDMKTSDRVLPWILVGAGSAMVVGGAILLIASKSDAQDRDEAQASWCVAVHCVGTRATIPENADAMALRKQSTDAASAGNTKQAVGFTIGGLGLAVAALGGYLFVRESQQRVGFAPLPGGGYAATSMSF